MVTGGSGLVGKGIEAIVKTEEKRSDEVWIFLSSKDADLTNEASTKAIFEVSTSHYIFHSKLLPLHSGAILDRAEGLDYVGTLYISTD